MSEFCFVKNKNRNYNLNITTERTKYLLCQFVDDTYSSLHVHNTCSIYVRKIYAAVLFILIIFIKQHCLILLPPRVSANQSKESKSLVIQ